MNSNEKPITGEKIELEIDDGRETMEYMSKVEGIVDENTLIISRPVGTDSYASLTTGQVVRIILSRDDSAYYYNAEVRERIKSGESISVKVRIISDRHKLQRRNYFRLEVMVPVTIVINNSGETRHLDAVDISGGGVKIVSPHKIQLGEELKIFLDIREIKDRPVKSRVVRSIPSLRGINMFEMGIEFIEVDNRVRQAVVEYVFTKQRELLKKRLR